MTEKMFCFQCEQTAGCTGCTGNTGVCGKSAYTSNLQDKLTGALIGLARATDGNEPFDTTYDTILEGLFATITNVNFDDDSIEKLISRAHKEKEKLVPLCSSCATPCPRNNDYDLTQLWSANEDIRSLKSLILFGIRGIAAYAYHAAVLGYKDDGVNMFLLKGLFAVGEDWGMEELLPIVMEVGEVNLKCMELLDRANTETFGDPEPVTVSMSIEPGPFVVISGHDLYVAKQLLEQTHLKGVAVYTHGEMLPAHAYPELAKYSNFKGHFGTAWQNQQKEFDNIPAPVLFTTNCLMPPKSCYSDRVFTTEAVAYPGLKHIGKNYDFSAVIDKAIELGGYSETKVMTGVNGSSSVITGFGRNTVLNAAGAVVNAVKSGEISHFFLVGGCDGIKNERNYYTDFVKIAPSDSIILTLGCGKYRFNDLCHETVAGLPRILDMGQCNDAFGAIKVAVALAEAFDCDVNDLPLSIVLSWYEQKAVSVLLTLLYLGIKNIKIGPSLPAFISDNILNFLVEHYGLSPITTASEDLASILSRKQ